MSMWVYLQAIKELEEKEAKELEVRVNKIKNSTETTEKRISDFPEIHAYFKNNFPKVDLSGIPIYMTSPRVMDRNGFKSAAGCYIDAFKSIFVKNSIRIKSSSNEGKFAIALHKLTSCAIDPEDVVMHELMHALSAKVRSGAGVRFRNSEEEFVYTNCVDFYRSKGRSDEEIIKSSFLPFCIHDVMSDKDIMIQLWNQIGVKLPKPEEYTEDEYYKRITKIYNNNASAIADLIVSVAKERSLKMIDSYNKYGRYQVHTNVSPDDDPQLRMDTIDMDCEL